MWIGSLLVTINAKLFKLECFLINLLIFFIKDLFPRAFAF